MPTTINKILTDIYGKYKIYKVDPQDFRSMSLDSQEFGNYGIYSWFPTIIPKNEIWISSTVTNKEWPIILHNAIYQQKLIDSGVSQSRAYTLAENSEKAEREKYHINKTENTKENNTPEYLYHSEYCRLPENTIVYNVDGFVVRNRYKTDFIEGGHDKVYSWIPKNEIWLEKDLNTTEKPYILIHEYVERELMSKYNKKYAEAHKIACKVEFKHRNNYSTLAHIFGSVICKLSPEWVEKEVFYVSILINNKNT